jgi:diguanylate cyclase (GGDEF)-like protein
MINAIELDVPTLLIVSAMVITLTGILFIVDSFSRSQDVIGRIWSLAYVAGVITTFSYLVSGLFPSIWWGVAVGNATVVLSLGAVWSGSRRFNGRMSLLRVAGGASALVAIAAIIPGPHGGPWAGGAFMLGGVGIFGLLAAYESFRGRMRAYRNARFLGFVEFIAGAYYLVRLVVFLTAGPTSKFFTTFLGTGITTLVVILFVTGGAFAMVALRGEESRSSIANGASADNAAGAASPDEFAEILGPVLTRSREEQRPVSVVVADVDEFAELNAAFGRRYGDTVLVRFVDLLREAMPSGSPVTRVAANRFAVMLGDCGPEAALTAAEQARRRLVDSPLIDDSVRMRVTASFGVASSQEVGYELSALIASASRGADVAKGDGRNRVALDDGHRSRR